MQAQTVNKIRQISEIIRVDTLWLLTFIAQRNIHTRKISLAVDVLSYPRLAFLYMKVSKKLRN